MYQGDGLNLYVYCRNNPVRYYDPSGYTPTLNSEYDISLIDGDGGNEENNVVDVLTGKGYRSEEHTSELQSQ